MSNIAELQEVSMETLRFMRGKYALDEIAIDKDRKGTHLGGVKFRRGGKTVVAIYIYENRFDFLVIFGKAEREKFEMQRGAFPQVIQEIYDNSKTYHDGKWMMIPISDLDTLEAVKKLILIKKKPNRKSFPKDQAIYGHCGHRCDLCVYYDGDTISETFRMELIERMKRVYSHEISFEGENKNAFLCSGCTDLPPNDSCHQKKCAENKGNEKCVNCTNYPCTKATAGLPPKIEPKSILAEDVTWAILPYVEGQYGN